MLETLDWQNQNIAHFGFLNTHHEWAMHGGFKKVAGTTEEHSLHGGLEHHDAMAYFYVDELEPTLQRVEEAGGKVLIKRNPVGHEGWQGEFRDTEGNFIGLYTVNRQK